MSDLGTVKNKSVKSTAPKVESVLDEDWRLFKPEIGDDGRAYAKLRSIAKLAKEEIRLRLNEYANVCDQATQNGLRARVATLLLRDLVEIGWEIKVTGHHIYLRPQTAITPDERKDQIRQQLLYARNNQLAEDSNKKFIYGVERPSRYSRSKPITDLIADGRRLREQLKRVLDLPIEQRTEALGSVCQPYLQLVNDDRDEHTNIKLIDIWRYFRHSWSTRYRSSPGRNLFYLVRDAAQPNHPVVGIAALGNTVMQLTPRDEWLGWTVPGLLKQIAEAKLSESEVRAAFMARLTNDFEEIFQEDLPLTGQIEFDTNEETLSRLAVIEQDESKNREEALRQDDETAAASDSLTKTDLLAATVSPLFRAKRARALREVLKAYKTLHQSNQSLVELAATTDGEWALATVLKQLKKRHSATSMMEITVCGAVAPYNHLLGGKLVCLLMMSPRVLNDYRTRYKNTVSIIASKMAGRQITKQPNLVFLGTTSLYTDHSSQYNRIRLTVPSESDQTATVQYTKLGRTIGFGSPNLSSDTEKGLAAVAEVSSGYRNVNFVFGEGQSPKLRQLREGFDALGLNQTNLLQHGSPRIVYGVSLATNTTRVLLGLDEHPNYIVPSESNAYEEKISRFWRERWLHQRLNHKPALEAVGASTPLGERVSRLIPTKAESSAIEPINAQNEIARSENMTTEIQEDARLQFLRLLYRNETAYADHVVVGRLRDLNIKTNLEDVVRKIVKNGGSVVITGNAGDGKTHTIRLMEKELKDAEVVIDASEISYDEIISRWQRSREQKKSFCIAINEGPLVDLIRQYKTTHPWLETIRAQLLNLVTYQPLEDDFDENGDTFKPAPNQTVVIDLSHRQVLSPALIEGMIKKMTDDSWYSACASCSFSKDCAVTYNRKMLRADLPRKRMVDLLYSAGKQGKKVTFREALAFFSYSIFAGKSCSELRQIGSSEEVKYYWNAFEGENTIFDLLGSGLDPVKQTNAKVDALLWRGQYRPEDFVGHELNPVDQKNLDEISDQENRTPLNEFIQIKRRWYFEHKDGHLITFSEAAKQFERLQDVNVAMAIRLASLIKLINAWWSKTAEPKDDALRLWTKLIYQPRGRTHGSQAIVSGLSVNRMRLRLYRPLLAPVLRRAFGSQPVSHLLLASADDPRYARLIIDVDLLSGLLRRDHQASIKRRLTQFNDTLSQYGDRSPDVRTIEVIDPQREVRAAVVVDLVNRRYDSAN